MWWDVLTYIHHFPPVFPVCFRRAAVLKPTAWQASPEIFRRPLWNTISQHQQTRLPRLSMLLNNSASSSRHSPPGGKHIPKTIRSRGVTCLAGSRNECWFILDVKNLQSRSYSSKTEGSPPNDCRLVVSERPFLEKVLGIQRHRKERHRHTTVPRVGLFGYFVAFPGYIGFEASQPINQPSRIADDTPSLLIC